MTLFEKQIEELKEAAKPLVKFLCDNFHPHVKIIVEPSGIEILEGLASVKIDDFIKDWTGNETQKTIKENEALR